MSKRFRKYLLPYVLLMVVISSLLVLSVYSSFVRELRAELRGSNTALLAQVQDVVEGLFSDVTKISFQMQERLELKPSILKNDSYQRSKGVQILKDYCQSNNLLSDIVVYFPDEIPGKLLSAQLGELSVSTWLVSKMNQPDVLNETSFDSLLRGTSVKTIYSVRQHNQRGKATNYVVVVCPVPIGTTKPYGYVLFYIEESNFSALIHNIFIVKDGMLGIYDADGRVLTSYSTLGTPLQFTREELQSISADGLQAMEHSLDGVNYTIVSSAGGSGCTYLLAMPTWQFFAPVHRNILFFLLTVVFALAVGIALAILFARKNNRLLSSLLSLFPSFAKDKEEADTYVSVQKSIQSLSSNHMSLISQSQVLQDIAREHFLNMLIFSYRFDTEEFRKVERFSGIRLAYPKFKILLFHILNYEEFTEANNMKSQELSLYGIRNILEELLSGPKGRSYTFLLPNRRGIALLYNYQENDDGFVAGVTQSALTYARQYYGVALTAGAGGSYDRYDMIGRSFFEASKVILTQSQESSQNIGFFQQTDQTDNLKNFYFQGTELLQSIRSGNEEQTMEAANRFIQSIKLRATTREMLYDYFFNFINGLIKELEPAYPTFAQQLYSEAAELFSKAWTEEFEAGFCEILRSAACAVTEALNNKKGLFISQVTEYVDAHYCEQTISISAIAEHFDFTPSYLTRLFRTQTGYTLKDYIDKKRMEQARLLLQNSSLTLREIVQRIGYVNESNFIKKFKAIEKMTPSQYRSVIQMGKENQEA